MSVQTAERVLADSVIYSVAGALSCCSSKMAAGRIHLVLTMIGSIIMTIVVGYIMYHGTSSQQMEINNDYQYQEIKLEGSTGVELEKEEFAMQSRCRTLPDVVIIGCRKCGTSALKDFIAFHPNIVAAEGETHYFDSHYNKGANWYINSMPPSLPDQLTMEKTPAYFITPKAPERLAQLSKDVKILLILRDPLTRSISDYLLCQRHGILDKSLSFEEVVLDSKGNVRAETPPCTSILDVSFYDRHYANWNKVWHGKIHIVNGEKFSVDPYSELVKVEKFLNLPCYFTKDKFYINITGHAHLPCFKQEDGQNYCRVHFKHPNVSQEVKDKLYDTFRPHMVNLCKQAGINFSLCHI